mmetsp:Transcript_10053/g.31197  ORF Transcript_10053/g.31197 Transcript_10053/m.31197 type:complete len:282 (+) Transcript_10053:111-956(+)
MLQLLLLLLPAPLLLLQLLLILCTCACRPGTGNSLLWHQRLPASFSPRVRDGTCRNFQTLFEPELVAPEVIDREGFADGHVLAIAGADLDLVEGAAVAVEAELQALHRELLGILQADVRLPLVSEQWNREVGTEARGDEVLIEERALVVHETELRRPILFLADDYELIVEGVHLAPPVVHHTSDVRGVLVRPHPEAILVEEVLVVQLVQHLAHVLKVAELAAGAQERVLSSLLHPADILVPLLAAVAGKGVARDQNAAIVLDPDDGRARHDGRQGVLLGVG